VYGDVRELRREGKGVVKVALGLNFLRVSYCVTTENRDRVMDARRRTFNFSGEGVEVDSQNGPT